MKNIILFSCFTVISITYTHANTLWRKVPGKDYTYRELYYQRQIIQDMRNKNKPAELKGLGEEFQGNVEITENKETKEKEYKVYVRNCGKVKLTNKSESEMKTLKNGSRVILKFNGSWECEVSDWRLF